MGCVLTEFTPPYSLNTQRGWHSSELRYAVLFLNIPQLTYLVDMLVTLDDFFDVLLTVHLSLFISVFNQLDAQNFVSQ